MVARREGLANAAAAATAAAAAAADAAADAADASPMTPCPPPPPVAVGLSPAPETISPAPAQPGAAAPTADELEARIARELELGDGR